MHSIPPGAPSTPSPRESAAVPSSEPVLQAGPAAASDPFARLRPDNAWAKLGPPLATRTSPVPLPSPRLVVASEAAAALLGIDPSALARPDCLAVLAGNAALRGGAPLATPWGGHREGAWAGRLGDERAVLLGEAMDADGRRWALQLEGAGPTPFARGGDGRIPLGAALRELLYAEALAGLGIPSLRGLAVVACGAPDAGDATGAPGLDERAGATASGGRAAAQASGEDDGPAAVLARLAPGFLRFGHFEHLYYCGRHDALSTLADHAIDTWFPALRDDPQPCAALLREVALRSARLVAAWQATGFCHGAIDTSTMSVLGLSMAGPASSFVESYDAGWAGPRAGAGAIPYAAQPAAVEWCCYKLGQALVPLLGSAEQAQAALAPFRRVFADELERLLRERLGLVEPRERDRALFEGLFALLHEGGTDFPGFFRALAQVRASDPAGDGACRALCAEPAAFDAWVERYRERLRQEGRDEGDRRAQMLRANPRWVLREAVVEDAVRAEVEGGRTGAAARLLAAVARPFDEQPGMEIFTGAAGPSRLAPRG